MTASLHCEDVLDRLMAGATTAQDHAELERHLAECSSCALHLRFVRYRQSHPASAAPWDAQKNARAVGLALEEIHRPRGLRWRWRLLVPAAAAMLVLVGAASAAWLVHARHDEPMPTPTHSPGRTIAVESSAAKPEPVISSEALETVPPREAPVPSKEPRAQPAAPSAAALFDQGRAFRAQNRATAALVVFARLQRAYPDSRETRVSYALVGTMLLDQGRAAEAVVQFERHLALHGEAEQESLAGLASAYLKLGRAAEEADAWRRLLAAYPDSVHAPRARQRLSALSGSLR